MYETTYNSTTTSDLTAGGLIALITGVLIVPILLAWLVGGFLLGRIFQKAGRPLWAGFVPIYNYMVLAEICGKPAWWGLLMLIPFINIVVMIILSLELARKFHKSDAFGIIALFLFSLIGFAILAFDNSKYQESAPGVAETPNDTPPSSSGPNNLVQ